MATDDKYDRQIRLWGSDGQKLLSEAHVCLLNATGHGKLISLSRHSSSEEPHPARHRMSHYRRLTTCHNERPRDKLLRHS